MAQTNSFGTFLEARQLLRGARVPAAESHAGDKTTASLLIFQKIGEGQTAIPELLAASGLEIETFLAGLKSLEQAGLVSVDVLGDHQIAELTPRGKELRVG